MTVYADLVARHGMASSHALLLDAVPDGARVLDVGCAEGYLAAALAARGCTVVGIEGDWEAAAVAEEHCASVVNATIEDPTMWNDLEGPFDRIVFGDVLEHTSHPGEILGWALGLLAPGGRVVVSLPNIAHWTARRQLLRGRFPHEDHGLFDRTHLRFFTRDTARALLEDHGLEIEREAFSSAPLPLESRLPWIGRARPALLRRFPTLFGLQVVLVAQRRDAP